MSSSSPHTDVETSMPLLYIINNARLHSSPQINLMRPQIIHILQFWLLDPLLNYVPDIVANCTEVKAVWQTQI